ncbi:MAG: mechanosensitive ion channel family protein [Bacillota bacterium]|jgi:small-conductance mechanosensitive channel
MDDFSAYVSSIVNTKNFTIDIILAAATLLAAWMILFLGRKVTDKFLSVPEGEGEEGQEVNVKLIQTLRILIHTLFKYAVYIAAALAVLHIFDVSIFTVEDFKSVSGKLIQALIIIVIARAVLRIGRVLVENWFAGDKKTLMDEKRSKTLGALLLSILHYTVYFIAGITVLQTFGVPASSIIASAGIVGLAVGFGAQNLVKDVISGFFILFEDQFSVGEYVTVAGITGTVEQLGLRSTTVREWTGHLYTIPNGEIGMVKNFDRGPILALVTVGIDYANDIDKAVEIIKGTLEKVYQEQDSILEMPIIYGVESLSDSSVDLLIGANTRPGSQWAVQRELRKRIKEDLDAAGMPIPFPTRTVYYRREDGDYPVVDKE